VWGGLDMVFKNNFEEGMQMLFESLDVQDLMRKMAEYFSEFQPEDDSNLYIEFLHGLKNHVHGIVFSTLNYDLLFEAALESCGQQADYFSTTSEGILFLKLHGSCNFLLQGVEFTNCSFMGPNIIDWPLIAVRRDKVIDYCYSGSSVYPAMCLYTPSKQVQFRGGRIMNIQKKWAEHVLNSDRILIVGVRPYEKDSHIWGPLSQTSATLGLIVSLTNISKLKFSK